MPFLSPPQALPFSGKFGRLCERSDPGRRSVMEGWRESWDARNRFVPSALPMVNPVAIVVPCHRVIGADASLAGYGGGIDRKHWLLTHEGAAFGRQAARRTPKAA